MPDWQQLGPVKVKVVGDKTLVTTIVAGYLWSVRLHTAEYSVNIVPPAEAEALAMAAADAIYDPQQKPIDAADRGPNWSFVTYIRGESP